MATTKEGRVGKLNDFGFKFEGDSDMYDYSSKGGPIERAKAGDLVRVTVTPKGDTGTKFWINKLEQLDARESSAMSTGGAPSGSPVSAIRIAALQDAVAFFGLVQHPTEECGKASEHVLLLAEKFQTWLERE